MGVLTWQHQRSQLLNISDLSNPRKVIRRRAVQSSKSLSLNPRTSNAYLMIVLIFLFRCSFLEGKNNVLSDSGEKFNTPAFPHTAGRQIPLKIEAHEPPITWPIYHLPTTPRVPKKTRPSERKTTTERVLEATYSASKASLVRTGNHVPLATAGCLMADGASTSHQLAFAAHLAGM
ncbi:hypothetical protein TNCT_377711 [Trichonephila clavata]|uniref:Uncharacterized protein n=1 Tax=Trichonephila clavata TaxID=2740835 RepID=A0A8X6FKK0_TRICU|nr:hypothetical protein TNCT_377711 [Trichonephila clavata]